MALTVADNSGAGNNKDFDPIPAAVHDAVCYMIVDLGTHYDERYKKDKHEVAIGWEIPALRIEVERDGAKTDLPRAISKIYTLHLGDRANLRKDLEAWRGMPFSANELSGFDLRKVLGASCMIQVMHRPNHDGSKIYANVTNIMPAKDKLTCENDHQWYSMEEGGEIPRNIPDWLRKKIDQSQEVTGGSRAEVTDEPQDLWPTVEAAIKSSALMEMFEDSEISKEEAEGLWRENGGNSTQFGFALKAKMDELGSMPF